MLRRIFYLQDRIFTRGHRGWPMILTGLFALLLAAPYSSLLAAPQNQTVPLPPTPTRASPPSAPAATPTARANDDEHDNDDASGGGASPEAAPISAAQTLTAVVNVARLNVREGPGVEYDAIGAVQVGDILTVIGRDESGDWWYICCTVDRGEQGWVSSQLLTPNFSVEAANTLPIISVGGPIPTPLPAAVVEPVTDATPVPEAEALSSTEAELPPSSLELSLTQSPAFIWQGREMDLTYLITNSGNAQAINVALRHELPPLLTFVDVATHGGGESSISTLSNGAAVVEVDWPALAAGEQVMVTVTVLISAQTPNGAVIRNIVAAAADNAESISASVNIAMPPKLLPDFR